MGRSIADAFFWRGLPDPAPPGVGRVCVERFNTGLVASLPRSALLVVTMVRRGLKGSPAGADSATRGIERFNTISRGISLLLAALSSNSVAAIGVESERAGILTLGVELFNTSGTPRVLNWQGLSAAGHVVGPAYGDAFGRREIFRGPGCCLPHYAPLPRGRVLNGSTPGRQVYSFSGGSVGRPDGTHGWPRSAL